MQKVEYPKETILTVMKLIDTVSIVGIENIKTMDTIINLIDTGIEKEDNDVRIDEQRKFNPINK